MDAFSRANHILRRAARLVRSDNRVRRVAARAWNRLAQSWGHVQVVINSETFKLLPPYRSHTPSYEQPLFRQVKAILGRSDIFVDVGANFGLYTLLADRVMPSRATVLAIEASPVTFGILSRHLELNDASARTSAINRAVADCSGATIMFGCSEVTAGDVSARIDVSGRQGVPVETLALDDVELCHREGTKVIKIDIEGAELLALKGAARSMRGPDPPCFVLAVHPMFLPEFGGSANDVMELLTASGYVAMDIHGRRCQRLEFAEYWCVPSDRLEQFRSML